jgi:hypothetical protein
MLTYNVRFINTDGKQDETQLEIKEYNREDAEIIELINLILSLKDEMGIKEVTHIECEDEEEY